jgi:multiple antibiotic resistance protein
MPVPLEKFLLAFIPLFVAMDPVGLVPFFLGMTQGVERPRRERIAWQAIITAAVVAVGFMFLGRWTFRVLGISVGDFQVAGGLILLVLAARELLLRGTSVEPLPEDFGIVPLGLPYIAGPATLTTLVILMDSPSVGFGFALLSLATNLVLVALAIHYADWLAGKFSRAGLRAVSKIIAMLLAAIAVSMIRRGLTSPATH